MLNSMRTYVTVDPVVRFWSKVRKDAGCWLWMGAIADTGYGIFNSGHHHLVGAHRFSFELHFGVLAPGECALHHCDNRACVRPDHLFRGSYKDNVDDMDKKGRRRNRQLKGEAHGRAKLTAVQVIEARSLWKNRGKTGRSATGLTTQDFAQKFGVSATTMHAAITGKTWRVLNEVRGE